MQLLEQHFDAAFAAPDGIKKLRELILTLAMQGKLVEQDPSDQPASELLKEIEQEKRRLVAAGKIKAPKPLPAIEVDEVPYEVPAGWKWVRLGSVTSKIGSGSTPRGGREVYLSEGIPFLRSQNIWNDGIKLANVAYISIVTHDEMSNSKVLEGDILLNITGASLGRSAIVTNGLGELNVSQHVTIIRPVPGVQISYLHSVILSPFCQSMIWERQVGMAREGLSKQVLELFEIPLPPLAEQRRIVARIDELMARCDELEALRAEREQKRLDVHTAALNALLGAQEPAAFTEAWQFMTQHFSDLHSVPRNVAELRKAVLQLAVMGKLVEQDPNDPPARELLKEIQEEKNRLIVAGKIRASKPLIPVTPEEMPYQVPVGWEWVRLAQLEPNFQNGISKREGKSGISTIVLRLADINNNKVSMANTRQIILTNSELNQYRIDPGDILITRVNGSTDLVGSFILNDIDDVIFSYCDHFIRMKFLNIKPDLYFINALSDSRVIRRQIESKFVTTAGQKTVNQSHISSLILPLPPLPEQRRIVAKINQLMALCDQLQTGLTAQTNAQSSLLASVMAAVTPASAAPTRRPAPARAPAGEPVRRGPGRPRKEVTAASRDDSEVPVVRRKPGRPRKEPTEAISAEATPVTARRGPGRPHKNPTEPTRSIPEATSTTDAIRRLEALKIERATGTRQVGLFESETDSS